MNMHPDDFNHLMKICRIVAIVWIIVLSFNLGRDVYHILREPL
jgi:hypothetical protein